MKNIPIVLLIMASFTGYAQRNDFKINTEVDEFTGDTTIMSTMFTLSDGFTYQNNRLLFSLTTVKGITYLAAIMYSDNLSFVSVGDKMLLKMEDGSMITLSSLEDGSGDYNDGKYRSIIVYGISEEDLLLLGAQPISKVRIETSQRNYDIEPTGKKYAPACMANFAAYYNSVIR